MEAKAGPAAGSKVAAGSGGQARLGSATTRLPLTPPRRRGAEDAGRHEGDEEWGGQELGGESVVGGKT